MSREVEDINPYEVDSSDQDFEPVPGFACRHEWHGRVLTVEAHTMPSYAYLGAQYFVTLDGDQRFTNPKMTFIEDFEWQFEHEGRTVTGRFAAKGLNNGFVRHYRIWIDGELLAESTIRIKDAGKGFAVTVGIALFSVLAVAVGFRLLAWIARAAFVFG